jgi:hypothetical protein
LVYNNEIAYTGNAINPTASYACIASYISYSTSNTTNNWINNTFANNKSTNFKNACMTFYANGVSPDFSINNAYNNVFWNNQNTISSTSVTTSVNLSSSSAQNVGTVVSNNVTDGVLGGNWGTSLTLTNNTLDLSKTNTTANTGPQFKRTSSGVGYLTDGSVELADWSLAQGSYLAAKGTATSILIDKAGNSFNATPAAGAYEYMFPAAVEIIRNDLVFGKVIKNTFISGIDAKIDIYSTLGKLTRSIVANKGQEISLPAGVYLVKAKTAQGIFVQKICI